MARPCSRPCYCTQLRSAARRLTSIYDAALEPVGITVAQFSLLRAIGKSGPLSLTELGRRVDLDRSTVGRNTRLLERMGLVQVIQGRDQREATMALTAAGIDALVQGAPLWQQAQRRIEAGLGPVAAGQLLVLLESLKESVA